MENKHKELLQNQIKQIDDLIKNLDWEKLRQWREETLMVLDRLIGEESKYYHNFENINYRSSVLSMVDQAENKRRNEEAYIKGLNNAKASLQAIIFGLEKGLF